MQKLKEKVNISWNRKKLPHAKKIKFPISGTEEAEYNERQVYNGEVDEVDWHRECQVCGKFGKDRELYPSGRGNSTNQSKR